MACIPLVYLISHIVDKPATGAKVIPVIFLLGLLIFPPIFSALLGCCFIEHYTDVFINAFCPWYFFDCVMTFAIQCWFIACKGKPETEDWVFDLFGKIEPSNGIYIGTILA